MPERAKARKNPVPASASSIAKGRELYKNHCLVCHGKHGAGDGPWASTLPDPPASFADSGVMGKMSDGEIFWKISQGRDLMPGYAGQLRAVERWHLVNYLRTLARPGRKPKD
ncbi:MAG: c-type cytochrome [Terriglobia bacterium]